MVKPVKFAHVVYQTRRFDEMLESDRCLSVFFNQYELLHFACRSARQRLSLKMPLLGRFESRELYPPPRRRTRFGRR
jgi:hypothetical protein